MSVEIYRVLSIYHIKEIVKSACIIFGAGMYGNKLYSFLKLKGLSGHIIAFGVSSREGNPYSIDEIPVKEAAELKAELTNCKVLLAMGKTHVQEAIRFLQGYGIQEIYSVTEKIIKRISEEIFIEMTLQPLKQNKIFISCYEGMGYRCNCKYIAEKLIRGNYPVEIVWVVSEKNGQDIPQSIKKVSPYTYEYYRELYTSKICITNNTIGLFGEKREGQYYINTWHGFGPFKKVQGSVSINKDRVEEIKETNAKYDLFLTGSIFYSQVYRDSFFYEGEIYECGAPRNDVFFTDNTIKESVFKKFRIPSNKKIVLYAPTFRTDVANSFDKYDLNMSKILKALNERFGGDYMLMYRFHHHLYDMDKCQNYYEDGIDTTYYSDIQELLVASDVVITDYSSLMWDFSIQRKPVFLYQNDESDYIDDRGFYCPVGQWPYPRAQSEKELIDNIQSFDHEKYINDLDSFLEKYGSCDDGKASEKVAEKIMKVINSEI